MTTVNTDLIVPVYHPLCCLFHHLLSLFPCPFLLVLYIQGMYLQLLAQTQSPVTNPYLRRRGDNSGSPGRCRTGGVINRRGRGGGPSDRFAFINAVMAHARNGGDPLEIEELCRSDGFTQDGYQSAGSPRTSPSESLGGETPAKDRSPRDVVFSGGCDSIEAVGSR